jgi:hypothetical protein
MMRPTARPTASTRLSEFSRTRATSSGLRTETDAVSTAPARITARDLETIRALLSEGDWAVIHFLAEVRLATGHQIARRLWAAASTTEPSARAARRALSRLEHWRLIERQARRIGGVRGGSTSIVYALGRSAQRLLAASGFEPRPHHDFGQPFLAHTVQITELIVRLAEADRSGNLELVEIETEPRTWRGFLSGFGVRQVLKPDLRVTIGAGAHIDAWWCEIDRSTESAAAIVRKAKTYLAYRQTGEEERRTHVFPRVVFLVPDHARRQQLERALRQLTQAPERLFSVWLFEEAIGRFAVEART